MGLPTLAHQMRWVISRIELRGGSIGIQFSEPRNYALLEGSTSTMALASTERSRDQQQSEGQRQYIPFCHRPLIRERRSAAPARPSRRCAPRFAPSLPTVSPPTRSVQDDHPPQSIEPLIAELPSVERQT